MADMRDRLGHGRAIERAILILVDSTHGNAKGAGELEVALVVRGYAHHRASAVTHQHVIGDPHGYRLTADRVYHRRTQRHTRFWTRLIGGQALDLSLMTHLLQISIHRLLLFRRRQPL